MLTDQLFDFLAASPSCYHAVQALAKRLEQNGYTQLREQDAWTLTPGGKYFVTRNGSSLLSFRIPQSAPAGFLMAAAHTDSPTTRRKSPARMCSCQQKNTAACSWAHGLTGRFPLRAAS